MVLKMKKKILFIVLVVSILAMSSYSMAVKLDIPPGLSRQKNEKIPGQWKKNTEFDSQKDFINEIHNKILDRLEQNEIFPLGLIEAEEETVPPIAIISWSTPVLAGRPVTVNAGESYDPDGGDIILIEWDINGDGIYEIFLNNEDPIYPVYEKAGAFLIGLRVTDDEGQINSVNETIIVEV
jgi:hypothetical protein